MHPRPPYNFQSLETSLSKNNYLGLFLIISANNFYESKKSYTDNLLNLEVHLAVYPNCTLLGDPNLRDIVYPDQCLGGVHTFLHKKEVKF